jgi:hypothetical protein
MAADLASKIAQLKTTLGNLGLENVFPDEVLQGIAKDTKSNFAQQLLNLTDDVVPDGSGPSLYDDLLAHRNAARSGIEGANPKNLQAIIANYGGGSSGAVAGALDDVRLKNKIKYSMERGFINDPSTWKPASLEHWNTQTLAEKEAWLDKVIRERRFSPRHGGLKREGWLDETPMARKDGRGLVRTRKEQDQLFEAMEDARRNRLIGPPQPFDATVPSSILNPQGDGLAGRSPALGGGKPRAGDVWERYYRGKGGPKPGPLDVIIDDFKSPESSRQLRKAAKVETAAAAAAAGAGKVPKGKFKLGGVGKVLGGLGTALMVAEIISGTRSAANTGGAYQASKIKSGFGSATEAGLRPSAEQGLRDSSSLRRIAETDGINSNQRLSNELQSLIGIEEQTLMDVSQKIAPSMRQAYARAGLI